MGCEPRRPAPRAGALWVALAVVLLCVLIWALVARPPWAHLAYWRAHLRETPDEILARSSGDYDTEAELALRRTRERLANPRIQGGERLRDLRRVNRIIRFSLLPREAADFFVAAGPQILSWRAWRPPPRLVELQNELTARQVELAAELAALPDYRNDLAIHEELVGDMFGELQVLRNLPLPPEPARDVEGRLHTLAGRNAAARREIAADGAPTAGAAAAQYLDLSQRHTNDQENSHDPAVTAALRETIRRLEADPDTAAAAAALTVDEIIHEIRARGDVLSRDPASGRTRPLLVSRDAVPVLERMRDSGDRMYMTGQEPPVQDARVARLVWARARHPRNTGNRAKIEQAVFDALTDSWKPGIEGPKIVCVQGRISRLVGALALLDFDADNWNVSTFEEIRNEIFEAAKTALRETAQNLLSEGTPGEKAAAAALLAETAAEMEECERAYGAPSTEDEKTVADRVRAAMEAQVDLHAKTVNDRSPGAVSAARVEAIKQDLSYVL